MPAAGHAAAKAERSSRPPTLTLFIVHLSDLSCGAWSANENRYRLRRRCAALHIIKGEREQRICFWVISADRPGRDIMGLCPEAADHAALVISQRFDFDRVASPMP